LLAFSPPHSLPSLQPAPWHAAAAPVICPLRPWQPVNEQTIHFYCTPEALLVEKIPFDLFGLSGKLKTGRGKKANPVGGRL
jgi:hypothetical protein